MKEDWTVVAVLGGMLLLIVLLIGMVFWSGQNFAAACERAGGVNINYSVCVPAGTPVLMVAK